MSYILVTYVLHTYYIQITYKIHTGYICYSAATYR
jgi:hypothetical protein